MTDWGAWGAAVLATALVVAACSAGPATPAGAEPGPAGQSSSIAGSSGP